MIQAKVNYMKQQINDELYTPTYAIDPLLKYLPKHITIWECTDFGGSNITKVLREKGWNVIGTNKEELNFLEDTPSFHYDAIVTNPPYSLKDEFIERCYELNKPFAMLMPITTLEGIKRGGYLEKMALNLSF